MNRTTTKIMDKFRPGWRERRAKRKSPWHLFKLLLLFSSMGAISYLFVKGYQLMQVLLFFNESLQHNYAMGLLPLMIPTFGLGIVITNMVLYKIPAARYAFEKEAAGDPELMYEPFMTKFVPIVFKYLLTIGIAVSGLIMWVVNTYPVHNL